MSKKKVKNEREIVDGIVNASKDISENSDIFEFYVQALFDYVESERQKAREEVIGEFKLEFIEKMKINKELIGDINIMSIDEVMEIIDRILSNLSSTKPWKTKN